MKHKICLVTGATEGIGKITATALAKLGATVVIVGRNAEKTQQTVENIRSVTHNTQIDYLIGDLSSQSDVRKIAADFLQKYKKLHILINNAGAVFMSRKVSADGLEMSFALNHMGYFLLTNLLLDTLRASAPARIINVSSVAHQAASLNFNDLQNHENYSSWKTYSQSKLANLYFTYSLAEKLKNTNLTVNALHPGFVATNFGKSNGGIFSPLFKVFQVFAISPEKGAETSIFLASSSEVENVTGQYFVNKKPTKSSAVSYDTNIAQRLWQVSEEFTDIKTI